QLVLAALPHLGPGQRAVVQAADLDLAAQPFAVQPAAHPAGRRLVGAVQQAVAFFGWLPGLGLGSLGGTAGGCLWRQKWAGRVPSSGPSRLGELSTSSPGTRRAHRRARRRSILGEAGPRLAGLFPTSSPKVDLRLLSVAESARPCAACSAGRSGGATPP